jgi:hypothetical protein
MLRMFWLTYWTSGGNRGNRKRHTLLAESRGWVSVPFAPTVAHR